MENIIYRKAIPQDTDVLVKNRLAFATELNGLQTNKIMNALEEQLRHYFAEATANNSCISFIAECNGEVAGIGSVHIRFMPGGFKNISGKWGYIMNMYTNPKFRRQGVCKTILNLLVEEGKKIGITAFELHATEEGEMVYKQEGFIQHIEPTYRKFVQV